MLLLSFVFSFLQAPPFLDGLEIEDEPHVAEEHTGITGAEVNVRIYRALRALQRRHPRR